MGWTTPSDRSTGDTITSAIWNENVGASGNSKALRDGGIATSGQAANDIVIASSATQLDTVAAGTAGQFLKTNGTGSPPSWATPSLATTILNKTSTYSVTTADGGSDCVVLADSSGGAYTVTLYSSASATSGYRVRVVKTTSDANAITVDGASAQTLNGLASVKLYTQYDYVSLVSDGSSAWIVEDYQITIAAQAYLSSNQTISTGTATKIACNTEVYDTAAAYDNSSNYRFTVPTYGAGLYRVAVMAQGDGNNDTNSYTLLYKDGSEIARWQDKTNPGNTSMGVTKNFLADAGDYYELYYVHNRGSDTTVLGAQTLTWFEVACLQLTWG